MRLFKYFILLVLLSLLIACVSISDRMQLISNAVAASDDSPLCAVAPVQNENLNITRGLDPENITFSWSSDGQQIAISSDAVIGSLYLVDVNTGNSKELLNLPGGESASSPSWQP